MEDLISIMIRFVIAITFTTIAYRIHSQDSVKRFILIKQAYLIIKVYPILMSLHHVLYGINLYFWRILENLSLKHSKFFDVKKQESASVQSWTIVQKMLYIFHFSQSKGNKRPIIQLPMNISTRSLIERQRVLSSLDILFVFNQK